MQISPKYIAFFIFLLTKMINAKLPTFFVNHGSPMHIVQESKTTKFWKTLSSYVLEKPKAILVISAHWERTNDFLELTGENPKQVFDFSGFPKELYSVKYQPKGSKELISRTIELLEKSGLKVKVNEKQGLDHGCWCPLTRIYPNADIPVVQLTLGLSLTENIKIGKAISQLREEGYLIICSGAITHNFSLIFKFMDGKGTKDEVEKLSNFVSEINKIITSSSNELLEKIMKVEDLKNYKFSIGNSDDHFLPLLVAIGTIKDDGNVHGKIIHEDEEMSLSMNVYMFD